MSGSWWWTKGNGESTPKTEEKKPELLDKPWRNVIWEPRTKIELKKSVQEYTPTIHSVPQTRILLIGAISAGKSSFFNSINSIFRGNIAVQARAGWSHFSNTTKYRTYQVRAGRDGQPLAFLLCDTMGLEQTDGGGVKIEDIDSILRGHIPDNFQFNPLDAWRPTDSETKYQLPLKDRIHCMVYVMDARTFAVMPESTLKKLQEIQKKLHSYDVPLMVLLTKVDEACPHVGKDLKNVYRSCYIKEQIYKASDCLGIPVSQVLPVKNYSHEIALDTCCDILLLTAMQQMLNFADNHLDNFYSSTQ